MGLNLITGPANAGKVALLLRRYLDALPAEPYLIVPNRSDVEERERELLEIQPALLGGSIVTFDNSNTSADAMCACSIGVCERKNKRAWL